MNKDFNTSFNEEGEKPRYIYKKNPLVEHSFQIFEYFEHKQNYEPVGEYTLIDLSESIDITEKKVSNLITMMNGRKRLIDLKNLTNERILFNIIPRTEDSTQQKVVFRTFTGEGVSKENAILTVDKGVFNEEE